MNHNPMNHLDPDLSKRVQEIHAACENRRRVVYLTRFGAVSVLTLYLTTALLYFWGDTLGQWPLVTAWLVTTLFAAFRWLRPLRTPLSSETIALYIDEQFPELQNRMITLMGLDETSRGHSQSWFIQRFVLESQAVLRQTPLATDFFPKLERLEKMRLLGLILAPLLAVPFLPIWIPKWPFGVGRPQALFTVEPGDARVPVGESITIHVTSRIAPTTIHLEYQTEGQPPQEVAMRPGGTSGIYAYTLTELKQETTYRVRLGDERSRTYTLTPWTMPEVLGIDLVYHYPSYLHKPPLEVPNGGDISAIYGTTVVVKANVNKELSELNLVFGDSNISPIPFKQEGPFDWSGTLTLNKNTEYALEPKDKEGVIARFRPTYQITVLEDKPPQIKVQFPYRDMEVTSLDEVSFEFSVSDDFGLADYGIRYQIANQAPVDVSAKVATGNQTAQQGKYTLLLENLKLTPGDLVTWNVWARDHKPERSIIDQWADPYFLEVRPFKRLFRKSVSDENSQQSGPNLANRQKKLIIATWNLRKSAPILEDKTFKENLGSITTEQESIQKAVTESVATARGNNPDIPALEGALAEAVAALGSAKTSSDRRKPLSEATDAQQRAYHYLLKSNPGEIDVSQQRPDGDVSENDNPLAGMDDLEMERNRNFYEEERRTQEQDEAAAKALDKIKELSQRQDMINEEISKLISEQEQNTLTAEELKRRLESLREEARKNLEELDRTQSEIAQKGMDPSLSQDVQSRLSQTRQQMNRELDHLKNEDLQEARSSGAEARGHLNDLEDHLQTQKRGTAQERLSKLQEHMNDLQKKQQEIQTTLQEAQKERVNGSLSADQSAGIQEKLNREKEALSKDFRDMLEEASSLANATQNDQEYLSRKLGDWLRKTSRQGIGEALEESEKLAKLGLYDELAQHETQIAKKLDQVAEELNTLQNQGKDPLDETQQALEELQTARNLIGSQPEQSPQNLVDTNYRSLQEHFRNAESLLGDHPQQEALLKLRRELETLRRDYKQNRQLPSYQLLLETIVHPLEAISSELEQEVRNKRENRQFILIDDGGVPEKYRKSVSDYFEILTREEGH